MSIFPIDEATMGVLDAIENGTAFDRTFETTIASVSGPLQAVNDAVAGVGSVINAVEPSLVAKVTGITTTITAAITNIGAFGTHVADVLDTIPDRISTFSSHQGLKNALEKDAQSCDTMKDFFGSVTDVGHNLVASISSTVSQVLQTVNDFKALAVELQTVIADTKSSLENALTAQINLTTGSLQTQLQGALAAIQNQFSTAYADQREILVRDAENLLTGITKTNFNNLAIPMFEKDFTLAGLANSIEKNGTTLGTQTNSLSSMISGENGLIQQAEAKLLKFAQASSIHSMFKGDPCVNTLMGYIGTDNLLSKLGKLG